MLAVLRNRETSRETKRKAQRLYTQRMRHNLVTDEKGTWDDVDRFFIRSLRVVCEKRKF